MSWIPTSTNSSPASQSRFSPVFQYPDVPTESPSGSPTSNQTKFVYPDVPTESPNSSPKLPRYKIPPPPDFSPPRRSQYAGKSGGSGISGRISPVDDDVFETVMYEDGKARAPTADELTEHDGRKLKRHGAMRKPKMRKSAAQPRQQRPFGITDAPAGPPIPPRSFLPPGGDQAATAGRTPSTPPSPDAGSQRIRVKADTTPIVSKVEELHLGRAAHTPATTGSVATHHFQFTAYPDPPANNEAGFKQQTAFTSANKANVGQSGGLPTPISTYNSNKNNYNLNNFDSIDQVRFGKSDKKPGCIGGIKNIWNRMTTFQKIVLGFVVAVTIATIAIYASD